MSSLDGKIAVVTGATRGIGRETARQLAALGATVYVTGRDPEVAATVASELASDGDTRSLAVGLDVADTASIAAFAGAFASVEERIDILINNAAAYVDWSETTSGADLNEARRVFDTNLFGAWATIQALLPLLRHSSSARIVNVSSGAGSHGEPSFGLTARSGAAASYGISKAALNALTSSLAAELDGQGILINSVCPGLTATFEGAEHMGARPITEGAASIVWAATVDDDGPSGGFFRDGQELPW